jgi:peptide/nickel transport system permease protein
VSTPAVVLEAARERRRRFAGSNVLVIGCAVVIGLAVFLAAFGPLLAPHDPDAASLGNAYVGPAPGHPLGYDSQGRDLLSRLLTGARTSMTGPFLVVAVSMVAGSVLAVAAAWAGRWVDATISTVLDILFAFPAILLAVLAAAVFGAGLTAPTLALAVAYTPYIARVLRGAALRERARDYVAACEVQGLSAVAICARHLIPNLMPLIVAQATLTFGYAMVDFAAISFIGLGVQPPTADWGVMVASGQSGVLQGYPLESLTAGLCIVVVVVAVNLLGERLAANEGEGR